MLRVGGVRSEHRGSTPQVTAPARLDAQTAARLIDVDGLFEETAADAEARESSSPGFRAVRAFIRDASFAEAGRAWGALLPLSPEGARLPELAAYLDVSGEVLASALALLDAQGVLEFSGAGGERAVRVEPRLAKELRS